MSENVPHSSPAQPRRLIVLGGIGICLDIIDSVRAMGPKAMLNPIGILDDDPALSSVTVHDLPVLGGLTEANRFPDAHFVFGIGSPTSFRRRAELIARTGIERERFATVIHPSAQVSPSARIGRGVVVLANCSIGADAIIEDHVLMLPNCVVGHNSSLGQRTMLAAGVIVSGNVQVGNDCYLGAASAIRDSLTIGAGCLLGLGSALVSDMAAGSTYYGNPARQQRP